jgi:multidrug transporter EmrE-like cation transporter
MSYIYLTVSFILNASANIFLKSGAKAGLNTETYNLFFLIKNNTYTALGILFFATSSVSYFLTLKHFPISVAYPIIIAASLLLTNSIAFFFLGEKITLLQVAGYILITSGIILVAQQK